MAYLFSLVFCLFLLLTWGRCSDGSINVVDGSSLLGLSKSGMGPVRENWNRLVQTEVSSYRVMGHYVKAALVMK